VNVAVLYEDSRGRNRDFPFHELVVRCVADGTPHETIWSLESRIHAVPLNGNANVLAKLRDAAGLRRLTDSHRVLAVFDRDKVGGLVGLESTSCIVSIAGGLRGGVSAGVDIVLLERNLETVLAAIRTADSSVATDDEFGRALQKETFARDLIFKKAAARPAVRANLVASLRSFNYLVTKIIERI